jgi:hypothetical protein
MDRDADEDPALARLPWSRLAAQMAVVALGYLLTELLVGDLMVTVGMLANDGRSSRAGLLWLILSAFVIAFAVGPAVATIHMSRLRHVITWGGLIFLNTASVLIEGAFFAPAIVQRPVALLLQQLVAAAVAALLLAWLVGLPGSADAPQAPHRGLLSWARRLVLASTTYLVCYLVFGALNYRLVTEPYYAVHSGAIAVPPLPMVFLAEAVRGPLIVLSLVPLLLVVRGSRRRLATLCGCLLFIVGGVAPLLLQARTLPLFLLLASGWEILFQNVITGAVTALLVGRYSVPFDGRAARDGRLEVSASC